MTAAIKRIDEELAIEEAKRNRAEWDRITRRNGHSWQAGGQVK